jgi:methionine salvage enolase-phosphatase E1
MSHSASPSRPYLKLDEATEQLQPKLLLGLPPHHILFLSDAERELDAAALAGFMTAHSVLPGTDASTRHPTHPDLTHLLLEG